MQDDVESIDLSPEIQELSIIQIFGYDGKIPLKVHPDQEHMIFVIGNKISILNIKSNKQEFLSGHTHKISAFEVSVTGRLIASGQVNHMGFRANLIVWDWAKRCEILRHEIHKVRVQDLTFSSDEDHVISLGGKDCGMIIVWNIEKNMAVCGQMAARETTGEAVIIGGMHRQSRIFISGGSQNLRLWKLDSITRRISAQDVAVGKLRRDFTCMKVDARDEIMYVGTKSGDVVKIYLNCNDNSSSNTSDKIPILLGCFARHNPKKPFGKDCEKFENGVRDLLILPSGQLIIGAGDGSVEIVEERNCKFKDYPSPTWPNFKVLKRTKVFGVISSLQLLKNELLLIGTENCEMYSIPLKTFDGNQMKLLKTCHTSRVNDIAFPYQFNSCFATASYESIRIWSSTKKVELLRIVVPNFESKSVIFSRDGKSIVSAWNDGIIRAFTPLTGKLMYAIPNAHNKGCTAVALTSNGKTLVSGGVEGQVRVWKIEPEKQSLIGVLKEHFGPISTVDINKFDTEVISASSDGSCIIWDLPRLSRKHVLFANTQFTAAQYFPTAVQILTSGTDRSISYWEVYDGSLVREKEGSKNGPINCLALNSTGEYFVSSGNDCIVKLWNYESGDIVAQGFGHAGIVTACKYSPDSKFLVTGGSDGAVFIWKIPEEFHIDSEVKLEKSIKKVDTHLKQPEQIREIGSRRSSRMSSLVTNCPPVDAKKQPNMHPKINANMLT
ncbi:CLUMA_CG009079, isoform A [Clunio marinus]|uniref:Cilia- and flagella-associated protein 52 n=1 Tax=Clunio marinus TaxID=568069 RepID=A0A1J1I5Q1_9DIPT|nr:CLUMA_CG009079, isoform A [Clunio marinus]